MFIINQQRRFRVALHFTRFVVYIPIKNPPITHLSGKKPRYHCATFHNEIHPRENNLIIIPSGQTNKIDNG
jgi:hypothetical protein